MPELIVTFTRFSPLPYVIGTHFINLSVSFVLREHSILVIVLLVCPLRYARIS